MRWCLLLIGALTAYRLLIAGDFELSPDEAHYALYGLYPALSYFDHPPLVGWLNSVVLKIGNSEYSLRVLPILINASSLLLLYNLSRLLYPQQRYLPTIAVIIFQLTPYTQFLGLALIPETLLLFFALASLILLIKIEKNNSWQNFIMLGFTLGLAGLSKYTAIFIPITWLIYLLLKREQSWLIKNYLKITISAIIALCIVSPVVVWNYSHDWISIKYQFDHVTATGEELSQPLINLLQAQLLQLISYGPLLYLGLFIVSYNNWRNKTYNLNLCLSIVLIIFFAYSSIKTVTLPHWTLIAWASICPLIAAFLIETWNKVTTRMLGYITTAYAITISLLLFGLLLGWLKNPFPQHPFRDAIGWQQASQRAVQLLENDDELNYIFVKNWSFASRLAWYSQPYKLRVIDQHYDQFDLWYGIPEKGDSGVLIKPIFKQTTSLSNTEASFNNCEELDQLNIYQQQRWVIGFQYIKCDKFK